MHTNQLYLSQNPYLLQHKDNPVAWKMWGDDAFDEARKRDVPLLVSIGYSTCHWCHVMAHEVFEDEETAGIMNEHLVCIKVDREELPEVDEVYMEACQAMNGSGGWPLNAFIDHEGRPFFVSTYVPKDNWKNLIHKITHAWNKNRQDLGKYAASLAEALQQEEIRRTGKDSDLQHQLYTYLREQYDEEHPDFSGRSPRFPSHTLYYYLLSMRQLPEDLSSKLESVLEAIQDSGLHDRVGGGFHRYSTDREWRVPHFEKMLYDNAQMMLTFALASSRFNRIDFLDTAENTASYLIRDMALYENNIFQGFASAEDADDPNGEGSFYGWTPDELEEILGHKTGKKVAAEWDITESNEHVHGVYPFRIPHPRGSKIFKDMDANEKMKCRSEWEPYYNLLLNKRQERPRPFRDDKILTDWNALTITGLTILYAHTGKSIYLAHAEDLARILISRFHEGQLERLPGIKGHITDYGHLALALFTLWETTCKSNYLQLSAEILNAAFNKFRGEDGIMFTSEANTDVFMRFEEKYDHSQPAGSNTLLLTWVRLRSLDRLKEYETYVASVFQRKEDIAALAPIMVPSFLQVLHEFESGPVTISIPGDFCENAKDLIKWTGTEIRLLPGEGDTFQYCEKDRCLMPSHSPEGLELKFNWKS